MTWIPHLDTDFPDASTADSVEMVIVPRARDIGAFEVRRALPTKQRQMVGPFIFFDQMGPAEFLHYADADVRPHPHIGLSTVTYLFDGEMRHRDSTGVDQTITPGALNYMTAGRGVTHSERMAPPQPGQPAKVFGLQTWLAMPTETEDMAPTFEHRDMEALPLLEAEGKQLRLILGHAYGAKAPTQTLSDMFYADAILDPGARLPMPSPTDHEDRAVYVLTGSCQVAGIDYGAGDMLVFRPGDHIQITAGAVGARMMLLGGATMGGPRHMWWNFVSSSREKLQAAKQAWKEADWAHGPFRLPPGDDQEYVPLPAPIRIS